MAEYIDRNLIEWFGCDYENTDCKSRECLGCCHAECSHSQVMQISTADVVEREKIDKAIEKMERYSASFEYVNRHDLASAVDYCIGVIQGNIGGSEEDKKDDN